MTLKHPTSAELVVEAGECLYGDAWRSPLARDLGLTTRTVQRIEEAAKAGRDYRVSAATLVQLQELCKGRIERTVVALNMLLERVADLDAKA